MNSTSPFFRWERVLILEDDEDFGKQVGQALEGLGLEWERAANPKSLEQIMEQRMDRFDLILADLTLPPGDEDGEETAEPGMKEGLKALKWLRDNSPALPIIAYTHKKLDKEDRREIGELGVLDLIYFPQLRGGNQEDPKPESNLPEIINRTRTRLAECRRLEKMLADRNWAWGLLGAWGVGVSVIDKDQRILFQDDEHRRITRGVRWRPFGRCYREWHGYPVRCPKWCCAVQNLEQGAASHPLIVADRVGDSLLYACLSAVPLKAGEDAVGAMELVVPMREREPLISEMPLRPHITRLAGAALSATGALQVRVFLHKDGKLIPLAGATQEGAWRLDQETASVGAGDDYWAAHALLNRKEITVQRDAAETDVVGEKFGIPENCQRRRYVPLLVPDAATQPIGLVRLDYETKIPTEKQREISKEDVLIKELAYVIENKIRRPWETPDIRAEIRNELLRLSKKCKIKNLRLYRASMRRNWLFGYLRVTEQDSVLTQEEFEDRRCLVREDRSSFYCCILNKKSEVFVEKEFPCSFSSAGEHRPPNRIEVPLFDEEGKLLGKLSGDNGAEGVTEEHLQSLTRQMAQLRSLLVEAFAGDVPLLSPGDLSAVLDWPRIKLAVAKEQDADEALKVLIQELKTQTGATSAYLRLYDPKSRELVLHEKAKLGSVADVVKARRAIGDSKSLSAWVFRSGREVHFRNDGKAVDEEEAKLAEFWKKRRLSKEHQDEHDRQKAVGVFPVYSSNGYVGTLAIHSSDDPEFFTPQVVCAIQEIASDAGKIVRDRELTAAAVQATRNEAFRNLAYEMAHQIRNPIVAQLNDIRQMHKFLKTTSAEEKLRERLAYVESAASRVAGLVDRMMDLAGEVKPKLEHVKVANAIKRVWRQIQMATDEAASIKCEVEDSDISVLADPHLLAGVLDAVLTNAVRHGATRCESPPGRIEIDVTGPYPAFTEPIVTMSHSYVLITIDDNGPGLTETTRDLAFDTFWSERPENTGLGLPAARQKVEAMGGIIRFANQPGDLGGARLWIALRPGKALGTSREPRGK